MAIHPPEECRHCKNALNCINGIFCTKTNIYVEYQNTPLCHSTNKGRGS